MFSVFFLWSLHWVMARPTMKKCDNLHFYAFLLLTISRHLYILTHSPIPNNNILKLPLKKCIYASPQSNKNIYQRMANDTLRNETKSRNDWMNNIETIKHFKLLCNKRQWTHKISLKFTKHNEKKWIFSA